MFKTQKIPQDLSLAFHRSLTVSLLLLFLSKAQSLQVLSYKRISLSASTSIVVLPVSSSDHVNLAYNPLFLHLFAELII